MEDNKPSLSRVWTYIIQKKIIEEMVDGGTTGGGWGRKELGGKEIGKNRCEEVIEKRKKH